MEGVAARELQKQAAKGKRQRGAEDAQNSTPAYIGTMAVVGPRRQQTQNPLPRADFTTTCGQGRPKDSKVRTGLVRGVV